MTVARRSALAVRCACGKRGGSGPCVSREEALGVLEALGWRRGPAGGWCCPRCVNGWEGA